MTENEGRQYQNWEVKIKKVDNGYIIEEYMNFKLDSVFAIQDSDEMVPESDDEQITMKKVLDEVKDIFGVFYSKHNEKNCVVSIKEKHPSPPENL